MLASTPGKMAEWSNAPDSKSGIRFLAYRGFESLSFRHANFLQSFNSPIPIGKLLILLTERVRKNSTRTTTYADFETPSSPYFAEKGRSF